MSEALLERPARRRAAPHAGHSETVRTPHVTVIEPRSGWRLVDWRELVEYRDLFRFLMWRSIKVRYAQSAIGIGWAVIQPVFSMLLFTLVFGRLARMASDGVPYALFSLTALVPWTYFAGAVNDSANSLVSNANMISKIYFPRLILPATAVLTRLLDFAIASTILVGVMAWFGRTPTWGVVMLPFLVLLMVISAAGIGMWCTALSIQYRDIKHAMGFIVQFLMYAAPVVYSITLIPEKYRLYYAIYPMVGVIEGFRSALLGTRSMPWDLLAVSAASALTIAVSGCLYFRRRERVFADVA